MTDTTLVSIAAGLKGLAEEAPDAPAVTCDGVTLTRAELERAADALARDLVGRGVRTGDYVSIVLPNGVDHPVAWLATWKLGAIPQPLSPKLARRELREIVELTKPAIVIGTTDGEVVGSVPSLPAEHVPPPVPDGAEPLPDAISPSWKAPVSGGSTGRPKVIRAGQPGLFAVVGGSSALVGIRPGGTSLIPAPLSHNAGLMMTTATLASGGHAVIMPRFDAEAFLRLVEEHRVTFVFAVPTMMTRIWRLPADVRERYDVSSIASVFHGAAPCPRETKEAWIRWLGPEKILEAYSATEAQAITLIDGQQWLERPGSVGRPVFGEIEIRDLDGKPVDAGTVGRVWVRAPRELGKTYEYLGATPVIDSDGWETCGDMGRFDEDGYLYLADRDTDMILVGGANVYPAEVEAAIIEHQSVLDACVIGLPDEDLGAVPHAIVQSDAGVDLDELEAFVEERLAPYKRPRSYEVVTEPLRDDAGKVRRKDMSAARR